MHRTKNLVHFIFQSFRSTLKPLHLFLFVFFLSFFLVWWKPNTGWTWTPRNPNQRDLGFETWAPVPPLQMLISILSRSLFLKRQEAVVWGQIALDYGWLMILSRPLRSRGDEPEFEGIRGQMMMIAFITIKSSLVPLIEGLCAQIYFRFEISVVCSHLLLFFFWNYTRRTLNTRLSAGTSAEIRSVSCP